MVAAATQSDPFAVKRKKAKASDDDSLAVKFEDVALLERYQAACEALDDAEAEKGECGALIKVQAEDMRLSECVRRKAIHKSLLLSDAVLYMAKDQWSKIKPERGEDLCRAFNGHFGLYFQDRRENSMDMDMLASFVGDPEVVAAFQLLNERGIVVQERWYECTELLFRDYSFDADVRQLCQARGIRPQQAVSMPKSVSAK